MKKQLSILFCLSSLGCGQQEIQKPADLIPESKMVSILADVHTAEAQIESTIAYPDTALMIFGKLHEGILQKHKVTEVEFRETFQYYSINVTEMDKLYEIITDTLIAREARYATKEISESELVSDSVKTVEDSARINRIRKRLTRPNNLIEDSQEVQ